MDATPQSPPPSLPGGLTIAWDGLSRTGWDALLANAGDVALEQSWRYGEAVAAMRGYRVRRAIVSAGAAPVAAVQAFERPVSRLGTLTRVTRGPVWLDPAEIHQSRAAVLRIIRGGYRLRDRKLALLMPELADCPGSQTLMSSAGARRVATGYSTIRLDLADDLDTLRAAMHSAWRGSLKSAERSGMKVVLAGGGAPLEWLLQNYSQHRRRARYVGPPPELIRAFADAGGAPGEVLMLRGIAGREPVGGILILRHGVSATFFIAWSNETGRRLNAHNLLLWRAIDKLKTQGVRWFDLGGVNAYAAPGVARFKLGLGGKLHTLAGTFM